jgi:hypothetical protein
MTLWIRALLLSGTKRLRAYVQGQNVYIQMISDPLKCFNIAISYKVTKILTFLYHSAYIKNTQLHKDLSKRIVSGDSLRTVTSLKGLFHQIRKAWKWYSFEGLDMDMRRLILIIF